MLMNKTNLNKFFLNLFLRNSIKVAPSGNSFLIFFPKNNKKIIGNAVPKAYPITAPIPPHVAAEAGPNNIQAPSAEATRLVDKETYPTLLFAVK